VVEARAFTQAPLPLVASAALAALSLAGQHLANVRRGPKLEGPCSLYLLTVNDSGERKSTVEGLFMAPIREWEKEQARALAPEVERHKGELAAWQAEKNGITERLKSLARAGKPTEEARRDLIANAAEMPLPPRLPRLLYQDITSEALAWCLSSGWPCGGIVSAEAGTVFGGHAMGKDSITRALGLLNLLWDASAPVNVDRRTSESFTVRAARVSLSLMIQEPTLLEFLDRAGALARGSGFLARFLLAWPASTQGTRFYQAPPEGTPALSAFTDRLGALLRYPLPLDEDERLSPPVLPLSPSAHRAWAEFHDAIEVELKDGGELRLVRDVASKTADNAARLACLFHLFAHGPSGEITQDHFSRAASIVAWHLSESRRFFGEVAMPVDLADAARLDRWLLDYARREQAASLPTREAQRLGPVRHKTRLADALVALEELGRARVTQEGRQKLIVLNPALVAEVAP
jgi:putative DNA primase/helicase